MPPVMEIMEELLTRQKLQQNLYLESLPGEDN